MPSFKTTETQLRLTMFRRANAAIYLSQRTTFFSDLECCRRCPELFQTHLSELYPVMLAKLKKEEEDKELVRKRNLVGGRRMFWIPENLGENGSESEDSEGDSENGGEGYGSDAVTEGVVLEEGSENEEWVVGRAESDSDRVHNDASEGSGAGNGEDRAVDRSGSNGENEDEVDTPSNDDDENTNDNSNRMAMELASPASPTSPPTMIGWPDIPRQDGGIGNSMDEGNGRNNNYSNGATRNNISTSARRRDLRTIPLRYGTTNDPRLAPQIIDESNEYFGSRSSLNPFWNSEISDSDRLTIPLHQIARRLGQARREAAEERENSSAPDQARSTQWMPRFFRVSRVEGREADSIDSRRESGEESSGDEIVTEYVDQNMRREHMLVAMQQRFMDGMDDDYFDYSTVDYNRKLNDREFQVIRRREGY